MIVDRAGSQIENRGAALHGIPKSDESQDFLFSSCEIAQRRGLIHKLHALGSFLEVLLQGGAECAFVVRQTTKPAEKRRDRCAAGKITEMRYLQGDCRSEEHTSELQSH